MSNPVGRPTKYDPIMIDKADIYLATCGREQTKLPKLTEYYRFIGISRQCADEWRDRYPEFGDVCKRIMEAQEEELIDDGLFGGKEINPGMAIFLLKAKHGMRENDEQKGNSITLVFNINENRLLTVDESPIKAIGSIEDATLARV